MGAAACLGALRFGPLTFLRGAHNFASNLVRAAWDGDKRPVVPCANSAVNVFTPRPTCAQATAVGVPALGLGYAVKAGAVPESQVATILGALAAVFVVGQLALPRKVGELLGLLASVAGVGALGYFGGLYGQVAAGLIVLASVAGPRVQHVGPLRRVDYFHYLMAGAFYVLSQAPPS